MYDNNEKATQEKPEVIASAVQRNTLHPDSREAIEHLVKKLLKTNAVFKLHAMVWDANAEFITRGDIILHPFMNNAKTAAYSFMCKYESIAMKHKSHALWYVHVHEGSPAALKLITLFNSAMAFKKRNPEAE